MNNTKTFWNLLNITLVIAILFGVKFFFSGDLTFDANRTVTVSGEGKTTVVPDIARVSFSVIAEGKDPKAIQNENAKKMNDAVAFVKSLGIAAKDIKTSSYNLYPQYDYGVITPDGKPRPPVIVGYTLTQTVAVKVRDFAILGDLFAGLPPRGINQFDHSFDIDDPEAALAAAREEAFSKARAKAVAMAKAAGTRLGKVVTFSEGFDGGPIPYKTLEARIDSAAGAPPTPTLEPGSQEVTVQVSVTYAIR